MNTKQALFAALSWLPRTGLPGLVRRRYGGMGTIFTLHSVVRAKSPESPGFSFMRDLDLSAAFLERVIVDYRARGYHVASMDEVAAYLAGAPPPRRFVAFTFDDGYRNNWDIALPLFERLGAPFIVYLATDMIDGKRLPWTYGLQDTLRERSAVVADLGGGKVAMPLASDAEKERAFDAIASFAAPLEVDARDRWVLRFFEENGVDAKDITRRHMMSWDMVRELARSKVATIGAHGVTHAILDSLGPAQLEREVEGARQRIVAELGRPVLHFAYPYGGYEQVRRKHIDFVASCGFRTAVTTRTANVFAAHGADPCALPRQPLSGVAEDLGIVRVLDSGLPSALLYGGRRVVTDHGGLKRFL